MNRNVSVLLASALFFAAAGLSAETATDPQAHEPPITPPVEAPPPAPEAPARPPAGEPPPVAGELPEDERGADDEARRATGARGAAAEAPAGLEPDPHPETRELEFEDFDRFRIGRLTQSELEHHECLMEAWDDVVADPEEGMTQEEFERAQAEYCE